MSEQYFSAHPTSKSLPSDCEWEYRGHRFVFRTDSGVFSKGSADTGSIILLKSLPEDLNGAILDLGCGWGLIGVSAACVFTRSTVTAVDINERAVRLTKLNAERNHAIVRCLQSDGFTGIENERFDVILTNPPIRAGKAVIYRLFSEGYQVLNPEGRMYIVIRKQQGAESAIRYLKTFCENTEVIEKSGGYWVIRCERGA